MTVRKKWIDLTCFGALFKPANGAHGAEFYILPIVRYDLAHPAFVEIEWYPKLLEGRSAKLFVPTHEVIAMAIAGPEVEQKLGFQSENYALKNEASEIVRTRAG